MQQPFWEKGKISNLISFLVLIAGLVGRWQEVVGSEWVLAVGLFGFAGGVTNWLAVKMLFDKVPLLYGSGVIPNRFREIRQTVKDTIMLHFFDEEYLSRFFDQRVDAMTSAEGLGEKIKELLESEEVDSIIDAQLEELMNSPQGMMVKMVGAQTIKPLVVKFVSGVGAEAAPLLVAALAKPGIEVGALRQQIDDLLTAKLVELTPERVKQMMEEVIREHLGWLIVWGNVFGGGIGLVAKALGY